MSGSRLNGFATRETKSSLTADLDDHQYLSQTEKEESGNSDAD
jgi:hypothetical protein